MKKIQIETIQRNADVQVIFVSANLISKALRASIAIEHLIEVLKAKGCIIPRYETPLDENEEPITDDRGVIKTIPALNDNGKQIIDYCQSELETEDVVALHAVVYPFLKELTDAFEE